MNRAISGFHILSILSEVDNDFAPSEGLVIVDYLKKNFPPHLFNLDKEVEILSTLKKDDYMSHFSKCLEDFYRDSTEEERNKFVKFAVKLITADHKVTKEENIYLNELYNSWALDINQF
jgi:hypothetical protein